MFYISHRLRAPDGGHTEKRKITRSQTTKRPQRRVLPWWCMKWVTPCKQSTG